MTFPEFDRGKKTALFFSRGRGRGHAAPDTEIIRALEGMLPDLEVRAVSYGTGAAMFVQSGMSVIDLGLSDAGSIVDVPVLAGKLIAWLNPDFVISHEEFPALAAAKIFDKPTLMLTDWFAEKERYAMETLKFADQILFLGAPGIFPEPAWVCGRVQYVGAILRNFQYGPGDKQRARRDLGLAADTIVISVFPGSWTEAETPILEVVLPVFDGLAAVHRQLIWVAGADAELLRSRIGSRSSIVVDHCPDIDRLMVASDVAITKTNRKAVFELQHLGVPTIAITFGRNPGDDLAVAALSNVTFISGRELTSDALASAIMDLVANPRAEREIAFCSIEDCARLISKWLEEPGQ